MEPEHERRQPNMRDVARVAGVSQRTVSNVVNGYRHVSPAMRTKVQAVIDELGYRPNVAAQRLRQRRTGIVALAVPSLTWPYFSEIAHRVQAAAQAADRTVLVVETEGHASSERNVLEGFRTNLIDGLILSSIEVGAEELVEMDLGIPVVLLGERIEDVGMLHLSMDNELGARQMVAHLHERGARTFLAVGNTTAVETSNTGAQRLRGFAAAMADLGVPESDWAMLEALPWTFAGGERAMSDHLRAGEVPDAIFCFNDLLALGVLRALTTAGMRVPDDVLVSGWDDIEMASYSTPSLTTVAPDKDRIAAGAVEGLLGLIDGAPVYTDDVVVSHRLEVRESTTRR